MKGPVGSSDRIRFTLADGMILVAGLAIGMTLARLFLTLFATRTGGWHGRFLKYGTPAAGWVLWALGLSLVLVEFRRPMARRQRVRRQGFVLCSTATLVIAVGFLFAVATALFAGGRVLLDPLYLLNLSSPSSNGVALVVVYVLARYGGARARPDWPDRSGRVLGVCWIMLTFWVFWSSSR